MSDTERVYVPYQHTARIQGSHHDTVYASVELWLDKLPDVIIFGDIRYRRGETVDDGRR